MRNYRYGVADSCDCHYTDECLWWQYTHKSPFFECFEFSELKAEDALFDTEEEASAFARDIVEWPYDDVAYVVKIFDDGSTLVIKGIKSKHGTMGFGRDEVELDEAVVYSCN